MTTNLPDTFKARAGRTHISIAGYLVMLERLKRSHGTADDMAAAIGREPTNAIKRIVVWMHRFGMISIVSWKQPSGRGKRMPRFRFGPGPDAPYGGQAGYELGAKLTSKAGVDLLALHHAMDLLWVGATTTELMEATGLARGTVRSMVSHGRKLKLFRIVKYRRRVGIGGDPIPVYGVRFGDEVDAARPERKSVDVLGREYRERVRIKKRLEQNAAVTRRRLAIVAANEADLVAA